MSDILKQYWLNHEEFDHLAKGVSSLVPYRKKVRNHKYFLDNLVRCKNVLHHLNYPKSVEDTVDALLLQASLDFNKVHHELVTKIVDVAKEKKANAQQEVL